MALQTHDEAPATSVVGTVRQSLERLFQSARPELVYGQPIEYGETKIIPCAEVTISMGFAGGSGSAPTVKSENASPSTEAMQSRTAEPPGSGLGLGGGGTTKSRPVALIVMTPRGVRVEPIVDVTKIVLATIASGSAIFFSLRFLFRGAKRSR
jgi:uncharacterized spore protein YtfJ